MESMILEEVEGQTEENEVGEVNDENSKAVYEDGNDNKSEIDIKADIVESMLELRKWNLLTDVQRDNMKKQVLDRIAKRYARLHTFRRRPSHEYDNYYTGTVNPYTFISVLTRLGIQDILIAKSHAEIVEMAQMWYNLDEKYGPVITTDFQNDDQPGSA